MLERNRGARRDRTRKIKQRGYRAWNEYRHSQEVWSATHAPRRMGTRADRQETERLNRELRRFLRDEGKHNQHDKQCGDCFGGGPCDWCYGGTRRKQQRLRDDRGEDAREIDPMYGIRLKLFWWDHWYLCWVWDLPSPEDYNYYEQLAAYPYFTPDYGAWWNADSADWAGLPYGCEIGRDDM